MYIKKKINDSLIVVKIAFSLKKYYIGPVDECLAQVTRAASTLSSVGHKNASIFFKPHARNILSNVIQHNCNLLGNKRMLYLKLYFYLISLLFKK